MRNVNDMARMKRDARKAIEQIDTAVEMIERIYRSHVGNQQARCDITITTDANSGMEMLRILALGTGRQYDIESKLQMVETTDGQLHMALPLPAGRGIVAAEISPEMLAMAQKNGKAH